jgi:Putative peptidoglycan binding domain
MRGVAALTVALTLGCSAIPAAAQQRDVKPGSDTTRAADRTRSVTGRVKMTTDKGLVVVGREAGQKDREWAFVLDPATRIESGGKAQVASELREGDAVTVTYTDRDGKVVAQSVKVGTTGSGMTGSDAKSSVGSGVSGVQRNSSTNQVRQTQTALKAQGHDPGPIDGVMGARTQAALRAFQGSNSLSTSGQLDAPTMEKLGVR